MHYLHEESGRTPDLRVYLNLDTLVDLRPGSLWPALSGEAKYRRLQADGFEGVQLGLDDVPLPHSPLPQCGANRIDTPADAARIAAFHSQRGDTCITVHAGSGFEDDDEAARLVEAILTASAHYRIPVYLETHRATITQDPWRTVQMTRRFPELLFNGDFSHYYCGLELVYGNWEEKLSFLQPIFDRIAFLHGRIASPGCMQVAIPDRETSPEPSYVLHFRELWTRAMLGFLRHAAAGDLLVFAPELLRSGIFYARVFPGRDGHAVEESDRYAQSLLCKRIARECFDEARRRFEALRLPQ